MKKFKLEKGGGSLVIFLIFLIFKLTGVINWSWWIVTSPLWIVPVAVILIILGVLTTLSIRYLMGKKVDWNIFKKP
jgi:membrane protein YdbS with pleckstrin-like domain